MRAFGDRASADPCFALALLLAFAVLPNAAALAQTTSEPYVADPYAEETTVDEMAPAMARAYVRAIQRELIMHGYAPGMPDGMEGPRTRQAIREYQRDAGLRPSGRASRELLDHLKFAASRVAARGEVKALIMEIQRKLADRGYYTGAIDGLPGPLTETAIRRFQVEAGIPVTGVPDRALAQALTK